MCSYSYMFLKLLLRCASVRQYVRVCVSLFAFRQLFIVTGRTRGSGFNLFIIPNSLRTQKNIFKKLSFSLPLAFSLST